MFHPFPSLLLFPSPLKFNREVWGALQAAHGAQRQNDSQPIAKVGEDQIRFVPMISRVGGTRLRLCSRRWGTNRPVDRSKCGLESSARQLDDRSLGVENVAEYKWAGGRCTRDGRARRAAAD